MPNKTKRTICVASNTELHSLPYRNRLKLAVRNTGIAHRVWPDAIQDMFLHVDRNNMELVYPNGDAFLIPLVDDVWDNHERYVRDFLQSECCVHPRRDRLIDLYFRVMQPDVARHFGK